MKKNIKFLVFILLICSSLEISAQKNWNTKEIKYTDGVVMIGMVDVEKNEVLDLKPIGKEVSVTYDPFFDKYSISWKNEEGYGEISVKFYENNSGGKMYKDINLPNIYYFVHDSIESKNKLTLIPTEVSINNGKRVKYIFVFDDLK